MIRSLIPFLLISLSNLSLLPEVTSYAKVSKNGEEVKEPSGLVPWITSAFTWGNKSESDTNEGRSLQDVVLTMSPIYVTPRTSKLQNGEVIDYTTRRYSTLDQDMIASLDAIKTKKQAQDRYRPSPLINKNNGASNNKPKNNGRPMKRPSLSSDLIPASDMNSFDFAKPPTSGTYDYKPMDLSDKPISKPIGMGDYPSDMTSDSKPPDSEIPEGEPYYMDHPPDHPSGHDVGHDHFSDFPLDYSGPHDHHQIIVEPYEYHHGVLFDHLPDYHHHHHHHDHQDEEKEDQTEPPEMNDQRLDKRPYSYYFIGKKLWYIPLYFSIYFIIYITALVLKSIARHKISLPNHLAEATGHARGHQDPRWLDYATNVLEGIENFAEKFGRVS